MVENEYEAKRRKAEARKIAQEANFRKILDEVIRRQDEAPLDWDKKYEGGLSLNEVVKNHPRNKSLDIVCTDTWHAIPQIEETKWRLTSLEISYVKDQPDLPRIRGLSSPMMEFGLISDLLIKGKPVRNLDEEARDRAEGRGKIIRKPSLRCVCTREVRFKSERDFLECLQIILILGLTEGSLELFEKILKAKSKRHASNNPK